MNERDKYYLDVQLDILRYQLNTCQEIIDNLQVFITEAKEEGECKHES